MNDNLILKDNYKT